MLLALLLATAVPRPADVKIFGDWAVACDPANRCEAVSMAPGDGDIPGIGLLLRREAGVPGTITIMLRSAEQLHGPVAFRLDGTVVARTVLNDDGEGRITGQAALPLAVGLVNSHALALIGPAGKQAGTISLKGSAAMLRYIDAVQGRAGTVSALAAKGTGTALPPAPPLPVVIAPEPPADASPRLPPPLIAATRKAQNCPADAMDGPVAQETHSLAGGVTLLLLSCGSGAYNATTIPLLVRAGKVTLAPFDLVPIFANPDDKRPMLVNADWDAKTATLRSYAKGRGIGDCGTMQSFAWDGARFRLVEQSDLGECRGAVQWPITYRATVRRR